MLNGMLASGIGMIPLASGHGEVAVFRRKSAVADCHGVFVRFCLFVHLFCFISFVVKKGTYYTYYTYIINI